MNSRERDALIETARSAAEAEGLEFRADRSPDGVRIRVDLGDCYTTFRVSWLEVLTAMVLEEVHDDTRGRVALAGKMLRRANGLQAQGSQ